MSYNIDHIEYIGDGRLSIRRGDATGLLAVYENDLAEGNWLEELDLRGNPDEMLLIDKFWWYGEFSGTSFDTLTDHLLPMTSGFAQLLIIWEGGDEITGLEVDNGKTSDKTVKFSLE